MQAAIIRWVKSTCMVKIKCKDLIDAVPIMPFQYSLWTTGKGELRLFWVHPLRQMLWQWSRIDRVYADIKIANNNKINHIIVSLTDHYNTISIDRLPSKINSKNSTGQGNITTSRQKENSKNQPLFCRWLVGKHQI